MLNVNSRTRYGILALIDLAENGTNYYVTAQQIADRKNIPAKFLGQILASLVQAGLVIGRRGASGGYRLGISPHALTMDRALTILGADGPSARCIYDVDRSTCTLPARQGKCDGIGPAEDAAMKVLASTTLADLCPGYAATSATYQI
ncbi:MAG: Rrf2 family transcriptional regulator [Chloroflexi bacterium]|nr:Rrf2 family transcriptional regulator [Chloroflexota bacterium]MCY3938856.1 Rrf2 family transcriptional regulator [Chloroflexota bacterium]